MLNNKNLFYGLKKCETDLKWICEGNFPHSKCQPHYQTTDRLQNKTVNTSSVLPCWITKIYFSDWKSVVKLTEVHLWR
jgi:hypothetical protein